MDNDSVQQFWNNLAFASVYKMHNQFVEIGSWNGTCVCIVQIEVDTVYVVVVVITWQYTLYYDNIYVWRRMTR